MLDDPIKPGDVTDIDRERAKFDELFKIERSRQIELRGTAWSVTDTVFEIWLAARSESAAEIERLRAEKAERADIWDQLHKATGEHPRGPVVALVERAEAAEARADRLQSELDARNALLREAGNALRYFVFMSDNTVELSDYQAKVRSARALETKLKESGYAD